MKKDFILYSWISLGPIILFSVFVEVSYTYWLDNGGLPFTSTFGQFVWFLVLVLSVLSGATAAWFLPIRNMVIRILFVAAYFPVMAGLLFYLHVLIACANGDCL